MQHRASANALRCDAQRPTLRLPFPHAASIDFVSQKVCKNTQKPPVLQGADANLNFQLLIFNVQQADTQPIFDLSAFLAF